MSHADPYADYPPPAATPAANGDAAEPAPRGRSRSRSPVRNRSSYRSPGRRSPAYRRRSPPPKKPHHAPSNPATSNVLGVFGLSIRTQERDLEAEFARFGRVEKVVIVYDQRTDRSRGFGFITMGSVEDATRCIQELNGVDLNGRRIRVDFSVTDRPHAPTPGEYMGLRRSSYRDSPRDYGRDRDYRRDDRDRDRDRYSRYDDRDRHDRDRRDDRDRDRDWKDRRSPPPRGGGGRYSPRRRSYSGSPVRGSAASPRTDRAPYEGGGGGSGDAATRW